MDPLTHVFLPLTVAYVLLPEYFPTPRWLLFGGFALLPDLDKLLGLPGLLHSLLTVGPLCAALLLLADRWRDDAAPYATLAAAFVASHLLLDFLDGSGVYPLYPLSRVGVGLEFPLSVAFGEGPLGVALEGAPVALATSSVRTGFAESAAVEANHYGLLHPAGVAIALAFLAIYAADRLGSTPDRRVTDA